MSDLSRVPYIKACPVGCGQTLVPTDIVLADGPLRRCRLCGQWASACTAARYWASMRELDDPAGTLPKRGSEGRRRQQSRRRLMRIARCLGRRPEQIRLLDVGCCGGAFLRTAVELGFDAQGVEPAEAAARAAAAGGLRVRQGLLQGAGYPDASFDAVTLFEVIEHLLEPLPLLEESLRILRPGGAMLIGTGNAASWTARTMRAGWEYLDIGQHGGHISFFNRGSLALAATRAGFHAEQVVTRNVRLVDKRRTRGVAYVAGKLAGELLNLPARLLGRGHDMLALLRRPK